MRKVVEFGGDGGIEKFLGVKVPQAFNCVVGMEVGIVAPDIVNEGLHRIDCEGTRNTRLKALALRNDPLERNGFLSAIGEKL